MFTKMAHEAFMKLKQVRRRSSGVGLPYIYIYADRDRYVHCMRIHENIDYIRTWRDM